MEMFVVGLAGAVGAEERSVVAVGVETEELFGKVMGFAGTRGDLEVGDHAGVN